ncbi:hypothetical protein TH61_07050 [Rufibacter sp. DG15C]|uniref:DUF3857 domain-containing protein n=1 Tax=Rufibacter sp. DG15C TaxID=1379909 RepID=UPI00078DB173|nr:DUF3857 domain-containing protein [Rufibacter sp. DG15C]AMM50989.1 hypothetical protein TH61_07050 [Rufibacter sp. DG15C]
MKNWILAVGVVVLSCTSASAGEPSYSALTIDASLKKDANAVVRADDVIFTVHSPQSASQKVRQVVTILNENGNGHASLAVGYDKLTKIDYIKGAVYDMMGKKVKTLKASDITDVSAVSEGTLFDDNRMKVVKLSLPSYPYTVEFEYQTSTNNLLFYPTWYAISTDKTSVEHSYFQVSMPADMPLRYRELNLPAKVETAQTNGRKLYSWTMKNITPLEVEPMSMGYRDLIPMVVTAPSDFEVHGYKGNMNTWSDFGKWLTQLNAGRDILPEATKQEIKNLTAALSDPLAKAEAAYNYMQNKTRYVGIQLGIGGWQPFEATTVDSKGYGDCKALSNYTKSLLEAAGVTSYYAVIRGGEGELPIINDFPSNQFNHVVLCVPTAKDTLWLECTSQTEDAGYTGTFTGDRYALLVKPEGGVLVRTPQFDAKDNGQYRSVKVKLNAQGGGVAEATTLFSGSQHEHRKTMTHHYSPEEQLKWLYKNTDIPAFEIKKFTLSQTEKSRSPKMKETLQLDLPRVASVSGKRLFITPNLMNRWTFVPPVTENRKQDVVWREPFYDTDTVEYEIPAGYLPESVPQPVKISSVFGEYKSQVSIKGGRLVYVRELTMHKSRQAPGKYQELVNFLKQVSKADQQQVVLAATPS